MEGNPEKNATEAWWPTALLVAAIVLWRIPFLNKGIDYTDTGFSLTNYHEAFLGNGINGIGLFMTNLAGGAIYRLLPCGHLLVFRILHWLFGLASLYLAYRIFQPYLRRNILLLVLLVLFMGSKNGEALFNYYSLTTFLLLLSVLLLRDGLVRGKTRLVFWAGIAAGCNVFVRLPNILFAVIGVGILLYGRWMGFLRKQLLINGGAFLAGVVSGVVFDIACMMAFLSPAQMLQSFARYANLALGRSSVSTPNFLGVEETSDAHSVLILVRVLTIQAIRALAWGMAYLLPSAVCIVLIRKIASRQAFGGKTWEKWMVWGLMLFLCLIFFCFASCLGGRNAISLIYLFASGNCLLGLWCCGKQRPEYSFLCAIAILLVPCAIFGSDLGWHRLGLMQNYLVPLALILPVNGKVFRLQNVLFPPCARIAVCHLWQSLLLALMAGVFFFQLSQLPKTYMDASYGQLNCAVGGDSGRLFVGMRTSPQRAAQLAEYQQVMHREELRGMRVAIFGYFPLGNVLGMQENYFSAPCVDYPSIKVQSLLHQIRQHQEKGDALPIVVISHVNQLQRGDDHYTSPAKLAVIDYLLSRAKYDICYESENYLVYVPRIQLANVLAEG